MKTKFLKLAYIFLVISAVLSVPLALRANAQTPTKSATPTATSSSSLEDKINELKDKVASRVAELNLVEKRGIIGTVTDISTTQITLSDINDNTKFIDVDELTKFSSPSAKTSFGISDIEKGAQLGILGLYNKSSRRTLARFIDVLFPMQFFHGTVSSVDKVNYNINIVTTDNRQFEADIETVTKTFSFSTTSGLIKAGFSKITPGETLIVTGFPDKKNANIIITDRIILLPDIQAPSISTIPQASNTPPTATGSGKSLTPIVR